MAGYGYTFRGYSTYNGLGPRTDDWNKPSYASDHVCRPVIVDAEGRKKPIISYSSPNNNTEYSVTKTETIVEGVLSPLATGEYWQYSPTKVEPYKDYRTHEDKWHKPSNSPIHDPLQKVDEFLTKVQTEASRPKFGPLSATDWRRTPISTGYQGNNNNNTGFGDYNDLRNKEFQKPSPYENYEDYYRKNGSAMEPTVITNGGWARPSRAMWSSPPDSSLTKPTNDIGQAMEYLKEAARSPAVTSTPQSSRFTVPVSTGPKRDAYTETRPSRTMWSSPDPSLSKPTNDIGQAIEYLKEPARSPAVTGTPQASRFTVPVSTGPTRGAYTETIDSREAARRYSNLKLPARQTDQSYVATIDSREAARKYGGTTV